MLALVLPEFPRPSGHRCVRLSLYAFPPVKLIPAVNRNEGMNQGEGERCLSPTRSPVLAIPDIALRADSSSVSAPLGDSVQAGPALSASGQDLASSARYLEAVGMIHPGPLTLISSIPAEVQEAIASARAPATRKLYSSKWRVFESWCLAHPVEPVNCPVGPATIATRRELDEIPLGKHRMVSAFMHGIPMAETNTSYWSSFLGLISSS